MMLFSLFVPMATRGLLLLTFETAVLASRVKTTRRQRGKIEDVNAIGYTTPWPQRFGQKEFGTWKGKGGRAVVEAAWQARSGDFPACDFSVHLDSFYSRTPLATIALCLTSLIYVHVSTGVEPHQVGACIHLS